MPELMDVTMPELRERKENRREDVRWNLVRFGKAEGGGGRIVEQLGVIDGAGVCCGDR